MRVWITKYALTRGLFEADAELCESADGRVVRVKGTLYHHPHWHTSEAQALARVHRMLDAKAVSLKKAEARLGKLRVKYGYPGV